jgi:hypothetical protein
MRLYSTRSAWPDPIALQLLTRKLTVFPPLHSATSPPAASSRPTTSSASAWSWPTAGARSSSGVGKRSMLFLSALSSCSYIPARPFFLSFRTPTVPLLQGTVHTQKLCLGNLLISYLEIFTKLAADPLFSLAQRARPRENVVTHIPDAAAASRRRPRPGTALLCRSSERKDSAGNTVERIQQRQVRLPLIQQDNRTTATWQCS